jgi:hypothetical protein
METTKNLFVIGRKMISIARWNELGASHNQNGIRG